MFDFQTVGETEKVLGGRQSGSQPARETALGLQPSLDSKRGFLSKPVSASGSGPTSEISSQAGEDDFEDNLLVSTPNQQFEQVLVVQAQNGVNMSSGTATTAPSTAPLTLAGPSTMEPFVPIRAQLGAQDTPSVIQGAQDTPGVNQGARPVISTEQTMQSTQRYSTLTYVSGLEAFNADITCCAYTFFGGLGRIRKIRSLTLRPMMFFITSQTRPVITQVIVQAQSTRSRSV